MFVLALMGHQDAGDQEVLHILLPHAKTSSLSEKQSTVGNFYEQILILFNLCLKDFG